MQFNHYLFYCVETVLCIFFMINIFFFLTEDLRRKRFIKVAAQTPLANSAFLKENTILVKSQYIHSKFKAVYLIQYQDYDYESSQRNTSSSFAIEYPIESIKGHEYILVDTEQTTLDHNISVVIEDNYTKAILIVSPNNEYFYIDILHPHSSNKDISHIRTNKLTGTPQLTRDELKYYKILGTPVALIKDVFNY